MVAGQNSGSMRSGGFRTIERSKAKIEGQGPDWLRDEWVWTVLGRDGPELGVELLETEVRPAETGPLLDTPAKLVPVLAGGSVAWGRRAISAKIT